MELTAFYLAVFAAVLFGIAGYLEESETKEGDRNAVINAESWSRGKAADRGRRSYRGCSSWVTSCAAADRGSVIGSDLAGGTGSRGRIR